MEESPAWLVRIQELLSVYGLKVLAALATLIIGAIIAKIIRNSVRKLLDARGVDPIIGAFTTNLAYMALMAFVVVSALGVLGVNTASFAAVIAAAGLAIGLALQGSLSNFAAGFLLIIFRPFKKGDFVEAGGTAGVVQEIQVFTTIFNTPDNKRIIVPNGAIMSGNITNFSTLPTRRVDWVFGVSYSDDIDKVKATIKRVIEADERIHKDPAPAIVLSALADSSVNFTVRAWVDAPNYWPTFFAINEKMKKTFDAEDISIPFPQRDVHLFKADGAA